MESMYFNQYSRYFAESIASNLNVSVEDLLRDIPGGTTTEAPPVESLARKRTRTFSSVDEWVRQNNDSRQLANVNRIFAEQHDEQGRRALKAFPRVTSVVDMEPAISRDGIIYIVPEIMEVRTWSGWTRKGVIEEFDA